MIHTHLPWKLGEGSTRSKKRFLVQREVDIPGFARVTKTLPKLLTTDIDSWLARDLKYTDLYGRTVPALLPAIFPPSGPGHRPVDTSRRLQARETSATTPSI